MRGSEQACHCGGKIHTTSIENARSTTARIPVPNVHVHTQNSGREMEMKDPPSNTHSCVADGSSFSLDVVVGRHPRIASREEDDKEPAPPPPTTRV